MRNTQFCRSRFGVVAKKNHHRPNLNWSGTQQYIILLRAENLSPSCTKVRVISPTALVLFMRNTQFGFSRFGAVAKKNHHQLNLNCSGPQPRIILLRAENQSPSCTKYAASALGWDALMRNTQFCRSRFGAVAKKRHHRPNLNWSGTQQYIILFRAENCRQITQKIRQPPKR